MHHPRPILRRLPAPRHHVRRQSCHLRHLPRLQTDRRSRRATHHRQNKVRSPQHPLKPLRRRPQCPRIRRPPRPLQIQRRPPHLRRDLRRVRLLRLTQRHSSRGPLPQTLPLSMSRRRLIQRHPPHQRIRQNLWLHRMATRIRRRTRRDHRSNVQTPAVHLRLRPRPPPARRSRMFRCLHGRACQRIRIPTRPRPRKALAHHRSHQPRRRVLRFHQSPREAQSHRHPVRRKMHRTRTLAHPRRSLLKPRHTHPHQLRNKPRKTD